MLLQQCAVLRISKTKMFRQITGSVDREGRDFCSFCLQLESNNAILVCDIDDLFIVLDEKDEIGLIVSVDVGEDALSLGMMYLTYLQMCVVTQRSI